ncbi:hypothetical protein [Nostoc sp. UHCC 0870]|uniref:hypothetical protein n=1 Tax=Nostoc sp. UHCC 0870 TaxID=2914041 RepID=UPI0030D77ABE
MALTQAIATISSIALFYRFSLVSGTNALSVYLVLKTVTNDFVTVRKQEIVISLFR